MAENHKGKTAPAHTASGHKDHKDLDPATFIFVNGTRFTPETGVKAKMGYKDIAALVGVEERQVVRRFLEGGVPPMDITVDAVVEIESGMKFLVESKPAPPKEGDAVAGKK